MASHKELIVWQKSMNLTQKVYEVTALFPYDEKYGLVSLPDASLMTKSAYHLKGFRVIYNFDEEEDREEDYFEDIDVDTQSFKYTEDNNADITIKAFWVIKDIEVIDVNDIFNACRYYVLCDINL